MKVRREVLKSRTTLLLAGAMAIVAGSSSGVWAADVNVSPISPPPEGWYFNGELEAGVRAFIQRPPSGFGRNSSGNFLLPTQTDSRAKFQEYGEIRPGLFLDWIYLNVGSNDGRYRFNFLGTDVGYNAQRYEFDFSEAGKQYLTLGWDQTPHLYSTSAKSLFSGVGTTNLTVADPVQAALQAQLNNASLNTAAGLTARKNINNIINGNATQIDQIELQRDTFSAGYRFTPTPDWDFNVGYSHLDRTGTQPKSLNYGFANGAPAGFPSSVIGVPVPVDDTTHTPEASGEYAGAGPWGRFNVKLGYAGSIYTDNLTQLNVQNPFCLTCTLVAPFAGKQSAPNDLRLPLPPSNQAHAFTASGATDVPLFKSRFTTTNQYSRWTQNDAFVDTSINGLVAAPLPAPSLNGEVTNFLSNNVLTSTLTPTLNNKVRFRYYEHINNTTVLPIGTAILSDTELQVRDQDELLTPEYTSYKKTNVNEDLTWHPWRWFTLGAGYEYERWQRSNNRFAIVTNENLGRMFADTKLTNWAMWRVSYSYGARRYDDYRIDDESWLNARMFDLANRNQQKARTLLDIDVTDAITLTPNAGLRWDDYPQTTFNQLGLSSDHSWNAGIDAGWLVSPTLRLTAGYNYEHVKLDMAAAVPNAPGNANPAVCNGNPTGTTSALPACTWGDNLTQGFHTVLASADWKAIPSKLDFRLSYIASWEQESHDFAPCPGNFLNCNGVAIAGATPSQVGLPWPDNKVLYQRFDATARYYVDPDVVRQLGWRGQVVAKLRYTFERNSGVFWQSDAVNAYFGTLTGNTELTGASRSTWLAYNNPNYTAQIIAASLAVRW
ncbi:MAG TPA: MtrB/PioB family decaheme-associated outer membrane protein [Pseudolabrys sp.]